jgi:hypothetical protein
MFGTGIHLQGATTFSITTLSIITFSITTLSIMGFFATLRIIDTLHHSITA